jgi:MFS transporter, DHA1 family, multidrug resistance protein
LIRTTAAKPGPLFALALGSISLIGPLAVHLFMPVIPAVQAALGLSSAMAQLTFSVAPFGMAFATLGYGSLSDRFGRRPLLLSGIALFLVGSAISAAANSLHILVLGRLVQAIGAGCGITLARAIAQDVYGTARMVKAIAYLTMFYTLGPMVAPLVGGVLIDAFGWRSAFGFALAMGGLIAFGVYFVVFESRPVSARKGHGGNVFRDYAKLFRNLRFTAFVLQSGLCTGCFLTMATAAASLMKDMLHRPSTEFGVYFLLFPIGYLFGSSISSRIGIRIANETMVLTGSLFAFVGVAVQSAILLGGSVTPWSLFVPGFFITFAQGLSLPYAQAGAMAVNPNLAGTAAGVGVFVQYFCGALFAQLYGALADGTVAPLTQTAMVSASLALVAGVLPFVMARREKAQAFRP